MDSQLFCVCNIHAFATLLFFNVSHFVTDDDFESVFLTSQLPPIPLMFKIHGLILSVKDGFATFVAKP